MSDRMIQIPFSKLMNWILEEYRNNQTIFSVKRSFTKDNQKTFSLFNEKMETVFGPAAGPHTQLSQNIIASYFAGARFFELKTVQTLDGEDLPVSKPCIKAEEEGYNVEWSTELRVQEAMEEYIKAWFALKIISKEFRLGNVDGFIFNMSVGYDLDGIKSDKINNFIEGLKNAKSTLIWKECKDYILNNLSKFENIDKEYVDNISPKVCTSATLSTLHGCPPEEIERISTYLLKEKQLNTFIKCNPTLLGYEFVRRTLDEMGYDYLDFDEHHFNNDLQYKDALPMIERLMNLSTELSLTFGVKLTNTFPVNIKNKELPGEEMYMSGAALYPLSLSLANKLTQTFDGKLQISYSGGADYFNIVELVNCGIWPITMATTLLKPGGYIRMVQIADELEENSNKYKEELIKFNGVDKMALQELTDKVKADKHHVKSIKPMSPYKGDTPLPIIDCFSAPCEEGCPINQDITTYIKLAGEGKYKESLQVIMEKNPLPFMTGAICNHKCMSKCTRNFYEEPVHIRDVKLESAKYAYQEILSVISPDTLLKENKTAIVGGGPAGIAAAHFLAKAGIEVTIFEKEECLGGTVKYVIPDFRIADEYIENDISFLKALGVEVKTNCEIRNKDELLAQGFKNIIVAIGATKSNEFDINGIDTINAIEFLKEAKKKTVKLGKNVVVIGGGNTAMDVARVAKRIEGVEQVTLLYRRTKRLMPADEEEFILALEDGVNFYELINPVSYDKGILTCEKMVLGTPDESGRRSPQSSGELINLQVDDIIVATGEKVDTEFINNNFAPDCYIIGDCNEKPKTIVEAIKDARFAVNKILAKQESVKNIDSLSLESIEKIKSKKGILRHETKENHESIRCLQCSSICENCIDVCPNRANVEILIDQTVPQILHLDDLCNECGNCASFCPTTGLPYKDKLTLFSSYEAMKDSHNLGFYVDRETGETIFCDLLNNQNISKVNAIIESVKNNYSYLI